MLKNIRNSKELEEYIFENDVDLRHKESGLSVAIVEPTEEGEEMAIILNDGTEVEFPANQLSELFEAAPLERKK